MLALLSFAALATPAPFVEDAGGYTADLTDRVFTQDFVHHIEITLEPDDRTALNKDPYVYVSGSFSYDGVAFDNVGVRLKGKLGSFRELTEKAAFKVDLTQYGEQSDLYGIQQLTINNSVADCTYFKTAIGYEVFALAGAKPVRNTFAWVRVNGEDYGLYVVLETPDDEWLTRVYADPSGNLYDGKYEYESWLNFTFLDFEKKLQDKMQLEEGTDVAHADVHAVTDALWTYWGTPEFDAETAKVVDWPQLHAYFAAEQWIGHVDGYWLNQNNYRVYFDPVDGKMDFLPWDLDNTFINAVTWGSNWHDPAGNLMAACLESPTCVADQSAAVADLIAATTPVDWNAEVDRLTWLTSDWAGLDPRRECNTKDIQPDRDDVRDWLYDENDFLTDFWGL